MHLRQHFGGDAFRQQVLEDEPNLALAADHADVARRRLCRPHRRQRARQMIERFFVMIVAAGHDDGVHRWCDLAREIAQRRADVADDEPCRRKSFAAGVAFTVVEHPHFEIDAGRQRRHRLPHMAAADDEQRDARQARQIRHTFARRCRRSFAQRHQAAPHHLWHGAVAELPNEFAGGVEKIAHGLSCPHYPR